MINTPMSTPTPTPTHHANAGKPIDRVAQYVQCEYTTPTPDGHATIACQNRAILMPGYYRACHDHIAHMLLRTLHEYMQRPAQAYNQHDHKTILKVMAKLKTIAK